MSINDATPQDWDRVRETGEPTFESYMERLESKYVYDSTEDYGKEVTSDAGDFADCWAEPKKGRGIDAWMKAAHNEASEAWEPELDGYDNGYALKVPRKSWDTVNNPTHYNTGSIECIEAIEESMSSHAFKGYLKGNCMKYLWRYDYKGKQVEDLEKADWYLNRLTAMVTEENS